MGYEIITLQNRSEWDVEKSTVCIRQGDPEWGEAIAAWRAGKPPTPSKDWKKGVFATTQEVEKTKNGVWKWLKLMIDKWLFLGCLKQLACLLGL